MPYWVKYKFLKILAGQTDMAFNLTLVCTFFYAVIACLNRNCILADPLLKNFFQFAKQIE